MSEFGVNVGTTPEREVEERFKFHPATDYTGPLHDEVRKAHGTLAVWIQKNLPDSREKSLALTELQASMFWCNAAVAYRTRGPGTA